MPRPVPWRRARRGIAVPGALYLIVLIGFLVATGVFTVARLRRGAAHRLLDVSLDAAADDALAGALLHWPGDTLARLAVGASESLRVRTRTSEPTRALVQVIRLSPTLYSLVANVSADRWPEAARRVDLLVRVRPPPRAGVVALSSAGDVTLGASARLLPDSAASCDGAPGTPLAIGALALAAHAHLDVAPGRAPADSIRVIVPDTSDSLSLFPFRGDDWQRLTAHADVRLAPGANVAASDHALAWAQGDLTLRGGAGSGVLLVEGRLTLAGPLTFSGVIVARGGVVTASDGVAITGYLASTGRGDSTTTVTLRHAVELRASRCAVIHALLAAVPPVPVHGRAWAELF